MGGKKSHECKLRPVRRPSSPNLQQLNLGPTSIEWSSTSTVYGPSRTHCPSRTFG